MRTGIVYGEVISTIWNQITTLMIITNGVQTTCIVAVTLHLITDVTLRIKPARTIYTKVETGLHLYNKVFLYLIQIVNVYKLYRPKLNYPSNMF